MVIFPYLKSLSLVIFTSLFHLDIMLLQHIIPFLHPILNIPSVQLIIALPQTQILITVPVHSNRCFITLLSTLLQLLVRQEVDIIQILLQTFHWFFALVNTNLEVLFLVNVEGELVLESAVALLLALVVVDLGFSVLLDSVLAEMGEEFFDVELEVEFVSLEFERGGFGEEA